MGTKVPENERARERKFKGTKVPWNFCSLGTKVLHRDLSFLGTKGLGYEKSVICGALTWKTRHLAGHTVVLGWAPNLIIGQPGIWSAGGCVIIVVRIVCVL